jgi:hypothetical protein
MYEIQFRAGRKFQEYDPQRRYASIHARGVDYNPRYVRITFAQNGKSSVLTPEDFSLLSNDTLIVRLPKELTSGSAIMSIENRGVDSYSKPVSKKLEICCAPK